LHMKRRRRRRRKARNPDLTSSFSVYQLLIGSRDIDGMLDITDLEINPASTIMFYKQTI
jgi:hypothetical protein